ncbi:MAG: hypothetical protein CMO01_20285 [Thalassobius sp.]|nr:hypothetical protein [Thalassovita sp.]
MQIRLFIFFSLVTVIFSDLNAARLSSSSYALSDSLSLNISKGMMVGYGHSFSQPFSKKPRKYKKPKQRKYDFRYLEIGIGPAVWQTSHEPLMENERNAIHFFVEYGDMLKPLSYVAGVNFNAAFIQEGYLLEPEYYFFHLKYSPSRKWYNWPIWMNIYGLAGATYWQASLTNTGFGGATNNENLIEEDNGLGLITGAGVSFEFFNFSLITQFTYILGIGQYEAGGFYPQDVHVGSAQINVMLSYRFFLSGLQWRCPTYK